MEASNGDIDTMENELMTVEDVCALLKISKSQLYKLTSNFRIPFSRPTGGRLYFRRSDVLNWALGNMMLPEDHICRTNSPFLMN